MTVCAQPLNSLYLIFNAALFAYDYLLIPIPPTLSSYSGLTVIETTSGVMNQTLVNTYLTLESVMCWVHVQIANRLASSAPMWAELFADYNSGTYVCV